MIDQSNDLVRKCQALHPSDRESVYRDLYEQLKSLVFGACYRLTSNSADAHDAAQETFAIVFRRIDDFRFEARFSSWVTRIAMNCCADRFRDNSKHARFRTSDQSEAEVLSSLGDEDCELPDEFAERREQADYVQVGLSRLSPKLQEITRLRYEKDLSYTDLATTLGISMGTVKSRLGRARQSLASLLEEAHPQLPLEAA